MKRCLYCLHEHDRRGRCCSAWCARRVTGRAAWITRSRRETMARLLEAEVVKGRKRAKWRAIAMGRYVQLNLLRIFGVQPTEGLEP